MAEDSSWYEVLGLDIELADANAKADVADVVRNGLNNAVESADVGPFTHLCVGTKGVLNAFTGAAAACQELCDLVKHCVAIARIVLGMARAEVLSQRVRHVLGDTRTHIDSVTTLIQRLDGNGEAPTRLGRSPLRARDRAVIQSCLVELKNDLDITISATTRLRAEDKSTIQHAIVQPPVSDKATVPAGALEFPPAYVERTSLAFEVIKRLTSSSGADIPAVLLGIEGGGKTVLASSIIHDTQI